MKKAGLWLIYILGTLSLGYLALYAYQRMTQPKLEPGEPIKIFRKHDAPSYS
jgi:hypothetical protein